MGFDNHSSTESDEDSNVRHDRFKSERFQKGSSESSRKREPSRPSDMHLSNSRYRERSPRGSHRHREVISSSSSSSRNKSKYETRNDHDRKDRSKQSHSRSSKSDRNGSNYSSSVDKVDSGIKTKKNLSSLLKSFDKQVESKRSTSSNSGQPLQEIGPALPAHLKEKTEFFSDSNQEKKSEEHNTLDSTLTDANGSNAQSIGVKSDKTSSSLEFELPLLKSIPMDTEHKDNVSFVEGPALPPHLQNSVEEEHVSCTHNPETSSNTSSTTNNLSNSEPTRDSCTLSLSSKSETETYGPALPPKIESSAYGPALPPKTKSGAFGPSLPPELKNNVDQVLSTKVEVEEGEESDDDDEDTVGPLPEGKMTLTQYQLDIRAANIKKKLEEEKSGSSKDVKKREEWMLELPPEKASNLGLGPRNFRKREAPDMSKRSEWTETPADRLRKAELAKSGVVVEPVNTEEVMKSAFVKERNEVMDKISKQSREDNRPKSLLELHQKKLKKKKKKEENDGKKKERRPFDRNVDLQVNRFDDAQKKAIYKKAQLLDSRFSTGESKYL